MRHGLRHRFWFETGAAVICAALTVLTLVMPQWIEALIYFEPDRGNGLLEWSLVACAITFSCASSALARGEWLRAELKTS